MSMIIPFSSPTLFITILSTEYFLTTVFVLIACVIVCGYFIWRNTKVDYGGKDVFLYLLMIFLMSLLFSVVDIKSESISSASFIMERHDNFPAWEYVINGNRIEIYERYSE